MMTLYPQYYKRFKCKAEECNLTCCQDWKIYIDHKSWNKYKSFDDDFLMNCCADDGNYSFRMKDNGKCSMLDEDGLCKLILKYGEEVLCDTCTSYPRQRLLWRDYQELSMINSCPHVLELLLDLDSSLAFEKDDLDVDKINVDNSIEQKMLDARNIMIDLTQMKNVPLWIKLVFLMKFSEDLLDNTEIEKITEAYQNESMLSNILMSIPSDSVYSVEKMYMEIDLIKSVNNGHEDNNSYKSNIAPIMRYFETICEGEWVVEWKRFQRVFKSYELFFENYVVNHIFSTLTPYLDSNLFFDEIQLIVLEYIVIRMTLYILWLKNGHSLEDKDVIDISAYYPRVMDSDIRFHTEFLRNENWISRFSTELLIELLK